MGWEVEYDVETVSEANSRDGWAVKAKRKRIQREATRARLLATGRDPEVSAQVGTVVRLVRIATRALDDDNLASSLKAVRDAVAQWLGVDDGPTGPIRWAYGQETTRHRLGRVRIEVSP